MRSRAEARKSFLHRLKSRLSTLEGDLKHVRERGHGRRLLEFSSRIPDEFAAFPGHFYKVFGGLSQLETASTTVLKHVEDRICTVYDRFCSSLSQTALELGKQEAAAPQPQQPAQEEEQQAADPAMQQPAESLGPGGEEVRRVRKVARPPLTKAQIAEEIEMMREGKWGERLEKNNGKVVSVHETEPSDPAEVEAEKERKEMAQERELRAQKKRREEAKLKKEEVVERKARREEDERHEKQLEEEAKAREEHKAAIRAKLKREDERNRPHSFHLHEPKIPHPEEDREWAAKKGITIPSYHHERHARSAHADVGGGAEGVAAQAAAQKEQRVRGLCQTAQPACNGDSGSRSATKVLPFPQSLYQHFGIEGDPRAVPFEQRARVELSICKAANCLCSGVGCESGRKDTQGHMLNTASSDTSSEAQSEEMTPEQMEEWWYNYTIKYNPGEPGRPGFHPDTEFPPAHPVQYEDGQWEKDPETGVGPKACIFMYAGIDCGKHVVEGANDALANATWQMEPTASKQIKKLYSFHPTAVRNVLWDDDESNPIHKILYFVIPSLHDYPTLPHPTKIDIREWVWKGRTVLFLGGVINIYVMNEIFGFQLEPQYQPGPYEWNERYCPGSPFEDVPRKVFEQGNSRAGMTGVLIASIPPEGKTFFDTNGASVAMCIHVGFGRACYVDQEFIRPMSDYGYGVWVDIVRAALNGGRCDCICDDSEYGDAPGEFEPGEVTYSGEIYKGEGSKLADDKSKCRCT